MKIIRCESCGKSYDFDRSEVCPECGAFNNVQGGHNSGLMEASYRQEKMAQEKARREHTAQEKRAQKFHRESHKAEQDAARWMEMEQKNPGQFSGSPYSGTAQPKRSPKWLIAVIIGVVILFNVLPVIAVLLTELAVEDEVETMISVPEDEWDIEIYEDDGSYLEENKHKVTDDFFTTMQVVDIPFWLGNLELTVSQGEGLDPADIGWEMEEGFPETQLWVVPFQGMARTVYEGDALRAVSATLIVEADGQTYEIYEEWDDDLLYALEEKGYQPSYADYGLYGEAGQAYGGHLVFMMPAGAVPLQMQLDLIEFSDEETDGSFDTVLERAVVHFQ